MSAQTEGAALFSDAQGRLEAISERLGTNDEMRRRLAQLVLSLEVAVPLRRDERVIDLAEAEQVSLRTAAYMQGIGRIAAAIESRGHCQEAR